MIVNCKENDLIYKNQLGAKFLIAEKRRKSVVCVDKITHISCEAYLSTVYTVDNKQYMVAKLLKKFEIELAQFGFIRANHNTIVNPIHIIEINSSPIRKLVLINQFVVKISRRKLYLFKSFQK